MTTIVYVGEDKAMPVPDPTMTILDVSYSAEGRPLSGFGCGTVANWFPEVERRS